MGTDTTQGWERRTGLGFRTTWITVGFLLLIAAVCVAVLLMHREPPQKAVAEPPQAAPHLDAPKQPEVPHSRGVVVPKVRVEIMPEAAGKVVYLHSQFHAGGLIRANERIAQIDPSGYELAVRKAQAMVNEAEARLDLERRAGGLRQPSDGDGQAVLPAILREPLIQQAEAVLESAKAELALAELNLSRTAVVLPYDVMIAGETVSLGQYAAVGRSLGVAYGTAAFEIEAPAPSEALGRSIAAGNGQEPGQARAVEVRAVVAGSECVWPGRIVRATNQVDPQMGTPSVVVEVLRPMEVTADRPALLAGMAVEVYFTGGREIQAPDNAGNVGER